MSIIGDCYNLYLKTFPDDDEWLPSDGSDPEYIKEVYDKITYFIENSFISLSRSIISGEYIKVPDIKELLIDFINGITLEYYPIEFQQLDLPKTRIYVKYQELNRSLSNALKCYLYFLTISKDKFDTNKDGEWYDVFELKDKVPENILTKFIDLTIPLCQYDYRFPANSNDFHHLLGIRADLMNCLERENSSLRHIFSLLLHKCHFIIRRIKSSPFNCEIGFVIERIVPQKLDIGDYDAFSSAKEYLPEKELLSEIKGSNPPLKSFVFLMKLYKRDIVNKGDIVKMDYVIERFLEIYQEEERSSQYRDDKNLKKSYDKFAFTSILNFLHNCRFSCYTQRGNPDLNHIKQEIRRIEDIQLRTKVKNFHPYEKSIEAVLKCIEAHLESNIFDDKLVNDKFEELQRLIVSYEDASKWSESHRFFPFQLPFDESLIHSDEFDLDLFVPSAYARYIDYDSLKITISKFKRKIDELRLLWGIAKERREVENLKNDIKNTDKKAIDLIVIFTASITFLFGIVNIFINNTLLNLYQLIANTIGFGVLLLLFASLYLLISPLLIQRMDWTRYCKTGRFIAGLILIVLYLMLIFFLYNNSLNMIDKANTNEAKIDTVYNEPRMEIKQTKIAK